MTGPWSHTAEAFLLHQLGTVSQFWKQGKQATFNFEVKEGEGLLNLTYRLPGAGQTIPPYSHSPHNGQVPRPPNPIIPLFPGNQGNQGPGRSRPAPKPKTRPPSYYRRNYRRAVLYRASKAAITLPPPMPNSLRELASRSLGVSQVSLLTEGAKDKISEERGVDLQKNSENDVKRGEADFSGDVEESSPSSSPIDSDREELRCEDGMNLSSTIQVSLISTPGREYNVSGLSQSRARL